MRIAELLKKLIDKKFYDTKEEIINKCNVFFAMNVITEEEYSNLVLLAEQVYFVEEIIEEVTEKIPTEMEETINEVAE